MDQSAPQQPMQTPQTPQMSQAPTPPPTHKNKMLVWALVGMGVVLALAIALIIVLITKDSDKKTENNNANTNTSQNANNDSSSVEKSKDIVTVDTQESGVSMTITDINKTGNALTINYKLNHNTSEKSIFASAYQAGVFTTSYEKSVPEPYFVSNADGQKYGLVKDSSGKALASKDVYAHLKKGESVNGYFTISLPPNNSSGSLTVGNFNIPNVTIRY